MRPIEYIEYRLLWFDKPSNCREAPKSWSWAIYAGQDGSVIAYDPNPTGKRDSWRQLRQTWDETGYWKVSVGRNRDAQLKAHRGCC
jgi:hypothetical protein